MATKAITKTDFEQAVLHSDKFVLVDFWAPWCMPCRMMAPILENASEDEALSKHLDIVKVDTEVAENQVLAFEYQIQSIPNLKLFYKGKVIKEFIGFRPQEILLAELNAEIQRQLEGVK